MDLLYTHQEWRSLSAETRHKINRLWKALEGMRVLSLEQGNIIRRLDENATFNGWWTLDGNENGPDYVADDAFFEAEEVLGYTRRVI